ncbi:hypothetical protein FS749_007895 [Ceratobasidium sp. UAMH 11750]|nr:hypothetical protein FS749_007895 [Ceratobasidium sp. UAMH 11750]
MTHRPKKPPAFEISIPRAPSGRATGQPKSPSKIAGPSRRPSGPTNQPNSSGAGSSTTGAQRKTRSGDRTQRDAGNSQPAATPLVTRAASQMTPAVVAAALAPASTRKRPRGDSGQRTNDDKRARLNGHSTRVQSKDDLAATEQDEDPTAMETDNDIEEEGSQVGDDKEPLTAQDMEEVISAWEASVRDVRSRVLAASVQDERLGKDLDRAFIGSAYVRFIGPGDVHGVVDLEHNPNKRGNPRGLNSGHVEILHDIFRRPNAKKDHESPLYLAVDGALISDEQRALMRAADARNLLSKVPPLVLNRNQADLEAKLEEELWVQRVQGQWLNLADLNDRQAELARLRDDPKRGMSYILNGNHRTRAMLAENESIIAQRDAVRAKLEKNPGNRADMEREMEALQERVEGHTWRCLVYDSSQLSKAAHNYLVYNEHERPAMGMGPGEKAWWLAQKFETEMEDLMNAGGTQRCSRASAANVVQGRWRREIGSKMTMTGRDGESDEPRHVERVKQLGDLAGTDAASRLFFNPLGMEFVLVFFWLCLLG